MSTSTTNEVTQLRVAVIGRHAASVLAGKGTGIVVAVFGRSIHIEVEGHIACFGGPDIGNGPLNGVLELSPAHAWPAGIARGESVHVEDRIVRLRRWRLDGRNAHVWRPEPWPEAGDAAAIRCALDSVQALIGRAAPHEGLSRLYLGHTSSTGDALPDALAHIAAPRLAALGAWLGDRLNGVGTELPPPDAIGLLGLGPGLTPAGDDVLCGALVALHAVGAGDIARDLAAAVVPAAMTATTALSRAFLSAAAEGEGGAALHAFIAAVIAARTATIDGAVRDLGCIGHSSGWDALAGAILVLRLLPFRIEADSQDVSFRPAK